MNCEFCGRELPDDHIVSACDPCLLAMDAIGEGSVAILDKLGRKEIEE